MTGKLIEVPFRSGKMEATQTPDSVIWASIRRDCENLGLDFSGQLRKLKKYPWATVEMMSTVAEDGKIREVAMLPNDQRPMWFATINTKKVKPEMREGVVDYQRDAARVLADHFLRGRQSQPVPQSISAADVAVLVAAVMKEAVNQLAQAQRLQGELLARLTESVAALAKPTMPAVSPPVQQVSPVTGVFALRERIRSMFPQADEYWRRRCVRAIERACRCQGVVPYPLYEGRGQANFLHQDMMPVVDQEITRVRGQWLAVNEAGARAERTLFDPQPQQAEGGGPP